MLVPKACDISMGARCRGDGHLSGKRRLPGRESLLSLTKASPPSPPAAPTVSTGPALATSLFILIVVHTRGPTSTMDAETAVTFLLAQFMGELHWSSTGLRSLSKMTQRLLEGSHSYKHKMPSSCSCLSPAPDQR